MSVASSDRTLRRHWQRVRRYIANRQYVSAGAELEAVLARDPHQIQAEVLLAAVLLSEDRLRDACTRLLHAATAASIGTEDAATIAYCLHQVGEMRAMRDLLDRIPAAGRYSATIRLRLAEMERALGRHERALEILDGADEAALSSPELRYERGRELEFSGRITSATAELAACLRLAPQHGRAMASLVRLRRATPAANCLDRITAQLARIDPESEDAAAFRFARFKELDDLGRYVEAWPELGRANAIMRARRPHDAAVTRRRFDTLMQMRACSGTPPSAPDPHAPIPIFIVGLPRSGTTLLERILGNHPRIAPCGELIDFPRQLRWAAGAHGPGLMDDTLLARLPDLDWSSVGRRYLEQAAWRAGSSPYFTDKLPGNFLFAGLIHRALPRARIIRLRRDPMDVIFSNWKAMLGDAHPWTFDLAALVDYCRLATALMDRWRLVDPGEILDVDYESLVRDPARTVARVFTFCGLPFARGCIDITRNAAPTATLSATEVREPIHTRYIHAWRRYAAQLAPVRAMLPEDPV